MPYRRLPNTDNARIRALENALKKGEEFPPFKLAFKQSSLQKAKYFLPEFKQAIIRQKEALRNQVQKSQKYTDYLKKARIYVSHFIQVLNMAVSRGEFPEKEKSYYGLDIESRKVPPLQTEHDIIEWGKKIIEGEKERLMNGGNPVTNPTIAVEKENYEQFMDAHHKQKSLQEINAAAHEKIVELRKEADEIILNIWNEVEDSFKELPQDLKRKKAEEYGLVYVFRKNEKNKEFANANYRV